MCFRQLFWNYISESNSESISVSISDIISQKISKEIVFQKEL